MKGKVFLISLVCFLCLFLVNTVFAGGKATSKKKVIDEVLEILKQKKIITEDKYDNLKRRLKAEEAEALQNLKQTAASASPVEVGYKKGFYLIIKIMCSCNIIYLIITCNFIKKIIP